MNILCGPRLLLKRDKGGDRTFSKTLILTMSGAEAYHLESLRRQRVVNTRVGSRPATAASDVSFENTATTPIVPCPIPSFSMLSASKRRLQPRIRLQFRRYNKKVLNIH